MSAHDEWRWTDELGVQRLVSTDELRDALASGVIPATTLVWRHGMEAWIPALELLEFAHVTGGATHALDAPTEDDPFWEAPSAAPPATAPGNASPAAAAERPPDKAGASPFASRMARYREAANVADPRAGGARAAAPHAPDPKGPSRREVMRTLSGVEAPEGARPGASSPPIIVPTAGGSLEPGVARAITQVPRYGVPGLATSGGGMEIPRAPKLPSTDGVTGLGAAPAPRKEGGGRADPAPFESGWSAPPPGEVERATSHEPQVDSAGGAANVALRAQATKGSGASARKSAPPQPRPLDHGPTPRPAQVAAATPQREKGLPGPAAAPGGQPPKAATEGPAGGTPAPSQAASRPPRFLPGPLPPVPIKPPSLPPREPDAPRTSFGPRVSRIAPERAMDLAAMPSPAALQAVEAPRLAPATPPPAPEPQTGPAESDGGPTAILDAAANQDRTAAVLQPAATSAPPPRAQADTPTMALPLLAAPLMPAEQGSGPAEAPAPDPLTAAPRLLQTRAEPVATPLLTGHAAGVAAGPADSPLHPAGSSEPPADAAATPAPAEIAAHRMDDLVALAPLPARPLATRTPESDWTPPSRRLNARLLVGAVQVPLSSLLGAGGALIFMVLMAFLAGRCSIAGGARGPVEVAQPGLTGAPDIARTSLPTPPRPCWVARQPRRWAPLVAKSIPFDVAAASDGAIAVGYARGPDEAAGIEVDPTTGAVTEKFSRKETSPVARVYPTLLGDERFVVATEGKGDLRSAAQVPAPTPFVVGLSRGALSVADRQDAQPTPLWPLVGEEELEALRAMPAGALGHAITFRRDKAVWGGWIGADRKPAGELTKILGSGGAVGKPSSGWNGREVAVIFADRPAGSAHWEIRVGHAEPGRVPSSTELFPLPDGGPGGDAFAPDIAGLPDGRWILIWTEGPPGSRAMRAQTLGPSFAKLGDPIALSPPAGNFGQGILGVSQSYVGAVFLSKPAASYELWGVILQCG